MTLVPGDLPQPGYGLESGIRLDLEEEAKSAVAYRGGENVAGDVAQFAASLQAAGWQERYAVALALLAPGDTSRVDRRVVTYVTRYETAKGAEQGFTLMEDESAIPTAKDIEGTQTIGEQSEITQDTGTIQDSGQGSRPFQSLDLTFRLGNLTAGVLIYDNRNLQPEVTEVEALALTLQDHITSVLQDGGPGLGIRALRLSGSPSAFGFDDEEYELRGDAVIPYVGETPDVMAEREVNYGLATDVYTIYQALITGDSQPNDDPYVVTRLYRFPNPNAASIWLAGLTDQLRGTPDEYAEVSPLSGAISVGDESVGIAYRFNASASLVTEGFLLAVRVGPIVARIQVDALPAPSLDVVRSLAEAQAACLADASGAACPENVPVPPELLQPAPSATPEASPVASPAA